MGKAHRVLIGLKVYSSEGLTLLKKIVNSIQTKVEVRNVSSVYKVKGQLGINESTHDLRSVESFTGLAAVVLGVSEAAPEELSRLFRSLEDNLKSEILHQSVSVELFLFERETRMTPGMTLPHPDFHLYPENLMPAAEVWGDYIHPVLGESIFSLTSPFQGQQWGEFFAQGKSLLDF